MRMYDIIKKKRDGGTLTDEEISFFVKGYTDGVVPDYQASALCMAIWHSGMTAEETTALTLAMRDSGDRLDLSYMDGIRVDKHSTGGVGDKTSLVVAPIVATLGVKVAKMSGRGLGHTGGTVDKLESFAGYRTDLTREEFERVVREIGVSIVGQSATLAPADKKLYALRDVTATVDSMPLIASSIMSKKLAADDHCIVLDVKCGSGSFMKSIENSRALASLMVDIGRRAGKQMCALITDMDKPLGHAIGNSLEVIEAIETLKGQGDADLTEICVALSARMLTLAGHGEYDLCVQDVERVIADGSALTTLARMVEAHGADPAWVYDTTLFPKAPYTCTVTAPCDGYITHTDTEGYGIAALMLGAGRNTKEDEIDYTAGITLVAKTGDPVKTGDPIATLYASDKHLFVGAAKRLIAATYIGDEAPAPRPLIFDVVE